MKGEKFEYFWIFNALFKIKVIWTLPNLKSIMSLLCLKTVKFWNIFVILEYLYYKEKPQKCYAIGGN